MQIRKIYNNVNPQLLFDDVKSFAMKLGLSVDEENQQTYSMPSNSSSPITRGIITFKEKDKGGQSECLRVHIEGSETSETKMLLDINTDLLSGDKIKALQSDLDFIFGSNEVES